MALFYILLIDPLETLSTGLKASSKAAAVGDDVLGVLSLGKVHGVICGNTKGSETCGVKRRECQGLGLQLYSSGSSQQRVDKHSAWLLCTNRRHAKHIHTEY